MNMVLGGIHGIGWYLLLILITKVKESELELALK